MSINTDYLEQLAHVRTPKLPQVPNPFTIEENHEFYYELSQSTHQFYYDYCQLRNSAKDLLNNPNDKEAEERLSRLVIKLSGISLN